ncbi:hypothetical protein B1A62_05495 [Corynebacterium diphtheriae]|nr:hypothetical protein B1A62_05495 [Corynebacterium diphtheriae]OSQ17611.1 hypothetical protein B1A52_11475 [Corynebacterium diphtheriae]OWX95633.1 hypothetical protein B1A53_11625 [Corynebacterium diphtheriae]
MNGGGVPTSASHGYGKRPTPRSATPPTSDTQSMHSKTGRATKRGYFEAFCAELHTKSLPNRPFE